MIRKLNRVIQDFLRPIRLDMGKKIWDKKDKKFSNLIVNKKLNMDEVNSIVFLRYDGKIGDMVINTLMFREIKKRYKDIKISVVSRGAATDIIKYNPYIDRIYNYEKGKEKDLAEDIQKGEYDVLVDFSEMLRVNQMKLINLSKAKINIGLDKDDWELFDLSYKKDYSKHITDMYSHILELFCIENPDLSYDIFTDSEIKDRVKEHIESLGNPKKLVVLNPFAASKHRSFNEQTCIDIGDIVLEDKSSMLAFIGEHGRKDEIEKMIDILKPDRAKYPYLNGILEVVEFLKYADYIITPDTSIVHIGVALDKPMTVVYRQDTGDNNSVVWGPNSPKVKQIFSRDIPKTGEESDINLFDVKEVI